MTARHAMPCCALVLSDRMASVSQCRAAGRRWRAGAITALQMAAFTGTRHQSKTRPPAPALTRKDLSSVVPVADDKLRTENANEINGVPVVPVVPVQMPIPRSVSASDALPKCPAAGCWGWCRWPGTLAGGGGTPPIRVLFEPFFYTGNAGHDKTPAPTFRNRLIRFINRAVTVHFSQ
jgi:hypothetical protein